jgi:hypothetical protein
MMDDLREMVAKIVSEADFDGDPWQSSPHKGAFRSLADRIIAVPDIVEWRKKAERWDRACMDALDD